MQIRAAQQSDLLQASKVCASAFYDDNLLGDLIHPFREQYPEDLHLYWLRRISTAFGQADKHFLVATTSGLSEGGESVVGFAQWTRKRAQQHEDPPPSTESAREGALELPPNRAADPVMEDLLERSYPFFEHKWTGPRAECWDLTWLAVDPSVHGQGAGRRLVAWGLAQAEAEAVCASVVSARGKETFYNRCGLATAAGHAGDGEGNPLGGVEGGLILFRDI